MSHLSGADDLDLLLIDGDNLLHGVRGSRDEGGVAWLLPRLSGWRPSDLRIVVALDGHPPPGEGSRTRATRGIEFHHAGRRSADDLIIDLLRTLPYAARSRAAVVTRDRGLAARAARVGGLTHSVDWLMRQLAAPARSGPGGAGRAVAIGQGKPPRGRPDPPRPDGEDERGWQPGRGATRKKGNPRRSPKRTRQR